MDTELAEYLTGLGLVPRSILATGGVAAVMYFLYRQALPKPLPGIPYLDISSKRIMGDVPEFIAFANTGVAPRLYIAEMFHRIKSPVVQYFMGPFSGPTVAVADYRAAHDLLLRHGKDLGRGWRNSDAWNGVVPAHFIAMEETDHRYKDTKNLGKDLMTPSFLNEVNAPSSYYKVLNFIELWQKKADIANDHTFDAGTDLGNLTYDIIMAAAFNISDENCQTIRAIRDLSSSGMSTMESANKSELAKFPEVEPTELLRALFAHAVAAGTSFIQPSPSIFHFFNNRSATMKNAFRNRDSIVKEFIEDATRRMAESGEAFEPKSALDYIVLREASAAKKAGREPVYDSPTIVQIMFGYLLGGQDSTHSTLSFMVKHLGLEQETQKKLRTTLREAFPDAYNNRAQPDMHDVIKAQIPFLDAFIEEVLRINNPAPAVMKESLKDLDILGYRVPKGTLIMFSLWGATFQERGFDIDEHKRTETSQKHAGDSIGDWGRSEYPAHEFHPERWLRVSQEEENQGELAFNAKAGPILTFSAGTRGCWGKRLAYLELKLVTTLLVWNFAFKKLPAELDDFVVAEDLFLKPKTCRVRLASAWDE